MAKFADMRQTAAPNTQAKPVVGLDSEANVKNLTPEEFLQLQQQLQPLEDGSDFKVMAVNNLADVELDELQQLGLSVEDVQKHKAIPIDIVQEMRKLKQSATSGDDALTTAKKQLQDRTDQLNPLRGYSPDFKLQPKQTMTIDQLPPDKRAEYQQLIAKTQSFFKNMEENKNESTEDLDPRIQATVKQAKKLAKNSGPFVMPKLPSQKVEEQSTDPGVNIDLDVENLKRREEPSPRPSSGADENPQLPAAPIQCECCGWYNGVPLPEPTEQDEEDFVIGVFSDKPFVKEFDLFRGKLKVAFRSLTMKEMDACFHQSQIDVRKARIQDNALAIATAIARYRMLLQLVWLKSDRDSTEFPESLADWRMAVNFNPNADALETGLREVQEAMIYEDNAPLRNETLLTPVMNVWQHFCKLETKLKGKAYIPLSKAAAS